MIRIPVPTKKPYEVLIGEGLLSNAGELSASLLGKCRVCLVTDDVVEALYADTLTQSLSACGFDVVRFVFPHGETNKSTFTLVRLLEFMAENRLTRTDCVFALGGGVVGDLAGFAAAVYLRGIRYVQLPTTLLAMVDSSVGGKTAVDLVAGKNLAGAFHQPSLVICDVTTLNTLPDAIFADGCAEVVKYGVINDAPLFALLEQGIRPHLCDVIASCVQNKSKIVAADEWDTGTRQLLNLGHTVGHAIEACSSLRISHGSAVAMGTVIAMRASIAMGLCPADALPRLCNLLTALSLPTECPFTAEQLCRVATADKKRTGDRITLILPFAIGDTRLYPIPVSELEEFFRKGL